jgi:hypothetical protein
MTSDHRVTLSRGQKVKPNVKCWEEWLLFWCGHLCVPEHLITIEKIMALGKYLFGFISWPFFLVCFCSRRNELFLFFHESNIWVLIKIAAVTINEKWLSDVLSDNIYKFFIGRIKRCKRLGLSWSSTFWIIKEEHCLIFFDMQSSFFSMYHVFIFYTFWTCCSSGFYKKMYQIHYLQCLESSRDFYYHYAEYFKDTT